MATSVSSRFGSANLIASRESELINTKAPIAEVMCSPFCPRKLLVVVALEIGGMIASANVSKKVPGKGV